MLRYGWGDDEKRYWVISFEGTWSTTEFMHALNELLEAVNSKPEKISLMIDLRHSGNPPSTVLSIVGSSAYQKFCFIKQITIISNRPLWKRLYQVFEQLYQASHKDLRFVETVDEAYRRLADEVSA